MGNKESKPSIKYPFVDDLTLLNLLENYKIFPTAIDLLVAEYYKQMPCEQIVGKIDSHDGFSLINFVVDDKYIYFYDGSFKINLYDKKSCHLTRQCKLSNVGPCKAMCVDDKYLYFLESFEIYIIDKKTFGEIKRIRNITNIKWLDIEVDNKYLYINHFREFAFPDCSYTIAVLDKPDDFKFKKEIIVDQRVTKDKITIDEHSIYTLDLPNNAIEIYDKKSDDCAQPINYPMEIKIKIEKKPSCADKRLYLTERFDR